MAFSGSDFGLYWKAADGIGAVDPLTESDSHIKIPYAFTPDGSQLLFVEADGPDRDLWLQSLDGSSEPLLASESVEQNGELSPNGRWLAYESNASGKKEVYVRPFPNVEDGQWLISTGGGTRPFGHGTPASCSISLPARD